MATAKQAAIILAVGARGRGGLVYTVCRAAARHGASVARKTTDPAVAYKKIRAKLPRSRFVRLESTISRRPVDDGLLSTIQPVP